MIEVVIVLVGGYLLGSISGALLLGRLRGIDIRGMGSGNAGGTNALRMVGWQFALGVVIIDVGKGALAAGLLPLAAPLVAANPVDFTTLAAIGAFMAVVGHVWPVFFRFRGGKGAGTAVGAIAVVAPWCLAPLLLVWVVTLVGTGYVGLATILAGLSLVPSMWTLGPDPLPPALAALAIGLSVLLVFTHRANLARMRAGDENRFEKARLLRRR
ncbi:MULTISPECIES: glycerol-3-phosphate 1-O-acyltransferase PlsY [unclassified Wenzhouxiangella]|uniref:glycerol-3-phosphate 1-O-acyltransferase PlsY n=1 Tax=unclassified Wenzhouxiangella TaxID=2613841 RepID=UPI000E328A3A|nr:MULTISPECIES: glycerol-3-phosphate 1-O-acyltransferase PlsY [unclassified Wenzhouxiangella]RFF26917.1 glycerol-3-phosphate 1-O-acyltransferase [Wenzhouxiangella sp. 15181]RFP68009.1 glycerol-3-phosphate 1-O-acyltransferase [Wenzhouxiangella sp. 15190]